MDIAAWRRGLGMERYAATFRDNEIDWDMLPRLTAADFKDLGVVLGSHRRKLLAAIAALSAEAPVGGSPLPNPPPLRGGWVEEGGECGFEMSPPAPDA
jgi:hypothetical protein